MTKAYALLSHLQLIGETLHNKGLEHVEPLANPNFLCEEISYDFYISLFNETISNFQTIQKSPHTKGNRTWVDSERNFAMKFLATFESFKEIKRGDIFKALSVILKRGYEGTKFELKNLKRSQTEIIKFKIVKQAKPITTKKVKEEKTEIENKTNTLMQEIEAAKKEIASNSTEVITTVKGKEVSRSIFPKEESKELPRKHVLEQAFDIMKELKGLDLNAFGTQMLQLAEFALEKQKECETWKQEYEEIEAEKKEYEEMMNNIHRMLNNSPITQQQSKGTRYQTDKTGIVVVDKDSIQ